MPWECSTALISRIVSPDLHPHTPKGAQPENGVVEMMAGRMVNDGKLFQTGEGESFQGNAQGTGVDLDSRELDVNTHNPNPFQ